MGLMPLKEETGEMMIPLSTMLRYSEKGSLCKPGRQLSPELNHADTLISDSQPPEL